MYLARTFWSVIYRQDVTAGDRGEHHPRLPMGYHACRCHLWRNRGWIQLGCTTFKLLFPICPYLCPAPTYAPIQACFQIPHCPRTMLCSFSLHSCACVLGSLQDHCCIHKLLPLPLLLPPQSPSMEQLQVILDSSLSFYRRQL